MGRVVDWCVDYEALAAATGDSVYPFGGEIGDIDDSDLWRLPLDMQSVRERREFYPIVCSEADAATPRWKCWGDGLPVLEAYLEGFAQPPAPSEVMAWAEREGLDCFDAAANRHRYSFVVVDGPVFAQPSVEAAVEDYRRRVGLHGGSPGVPLGFLNLGPRRLVESPEDAVVVLGETVSVIDGVVRGLAQNRSEGLWARDVAVTASDPDGVVGVWRFPLAVQPGEVLPFEIEGWEGPEDPAGVSFWVSGDFSPRIDISRSLRLGWTKFWVDEPEFLQLFSLQMAQEGIPEGYFDVVEVVIEREASTAHPRLAEAALQQTIEELVVYAAVFWGGTVFDVFELTPMVDVSSPGSRSEWVEVSGIPAELPSGRVVPTPTVGVADSGPLIWAGSAAGGSRESSDGAG